MRKLIKTTLRILCVVAILLCTTITAFAHSGRTDSSGGHKDNKNASGLGSYHYHCGGFPAHLHTSGYCPYRDVLPSSVSINVEKQVLGIGESVKITGSVYPANSCNTQLTWACSNTDVISLKNGVIEAKNYGSAVITAESFNGKSKSITITVKEITAEKVEITTTSNSGMNIYIGDSFDLNAIITPSNVDNPSIIWTTSDASIAQVNSNGRVDAIAEGSAIISATAANGIAGTYKVQVREKYVEKVEFPEETIDLGLGRSYDLVATVTPKDATYTQLTWESDNPAVATVNEHGKIKAISCGNAVISAISTNNISACITVNVDEIPAENIKIVGTPQLHIAEETKLKAIFTPNDTTLKDVEWSSSNESVITVDATGSVSGVGLGIATVTAKQNDVTDMFQIEVIPIDVEKIVISSDGGVVFNRGDSAHLTATVFPRNATFPDVTWVSSDVSVASIDENGVIYAHALGTTLITAISKDGHEESIEITVELSDTTTAITACSFVALITTLVVLFKKRKKHTT